jgi:hypothetical protein
MATVFEPIRPVPPMTTIFMAYPPLSMTGDPKWPRMQTWQMWKSIRASSDVGEQAPVHSIAFLLESSASSTEINRRCP